MLKIYYKDGEERKFVKVSLWSIIKANLVSSIIIWIMAYTILYTLTLWLELL